MINKDKIRIGSQSAIYRRWAAMMTRCRNPRQPNWKYYGGRGIKVCERWHDPVNFIADMGATFDPSLTLERIDNDGNYGPDNCRWATKAEQLRNRRDNKLLTLNGRTQCLADWAVEINIDISTLWKRINDGGWSDERVLTTPIIDAPTRCAKARSVWKEQRIGGNR